MNIVSNAATAAEMKSEILAFLKTRAEQERGKTLTTNRKTAKDIYIARAMFVQELIEELSNVSVEGAGEPVAWTSLSQLKVLEQGSTGVMWREKDEYMSVPLYAGAPAPIQS